MKTITIKINDDESLHTEIDGELNYNDFIATIFSVLSASASNIVKQIEERGEYKDKEDLYDIFDGLFFKFMEDVFPDVQPRPFDLTDAAIIYAQDQIIKRAEKKGITYEEALKQYEDKAKAHILESGGRTS